MVSAFAGADDRAKFCILGCQWRGNVILSLSICLVTLSVREIKVRGELRWQRKHEVWYPKGFTGRWLCVAAGGDCLMDYANGPCDSERELPLSSICSLATAMQQFIGTTGEQGSDVQTHSVAFNTLLLAACTGSTFSVVAVVALPEDTPSDLSTAELRFKAMEIHAALRSGELGTQLQLLAGAAGQEREDKAANYTPSSCLLEAEGKGGDTPLPPEAASAAREVFATALSQRASALLVAMLDELPEGDRREVRKLCLFDVRLEILCTVPVEPPGTLQDMALLLQAGEAVSLSQERLTSIWVWNSASGDASEIAVLCAQAWPFFVGAMLETRPCGRPSGESGKGMVCRASSDVLGHLPTFKSRMEAVAAQLCTLLGLHSPAKPQE
ncbi:unnamed protein product [Symbiodinium pilosum]|uniref:Uncharacterized protein n=1 Tax=Symbiodinium pilosum TaxID=2952 RepID=A0A812X6M0_SYMPI|nr:unnamed protein product [Symbiodinium pilosum]